MFSLKKFGIAKQSFSTYLIFEGRGIAKLNTKTRKFETYPNYKTLPFIIKFNAKRFIKQMGY